jgi:hypothetical protein
MAPVKGLFSGRREPSISTLPAVDGFFSGEFTWTNDDSTVYYKGNVPEEGQVYVIPLAGPPGVRRGISSAAAPTVPGGTRTASR